MSMIDENLTNVVRTISERFVNSNLRLAVRKGGRYFRSGGDLSNGRNDPPRPDIGCIQTIFEGLVTYHLCGSGYIASDAPISEYLSEFSSPGHVGRDIKVIHLMSHATGFHAPPSFFEGAGFRTCDELTTFFNQTPASFPPGSVSSVNSLSRNLLHGLLERVVGKTVYELVSELILEPNKLSAEYLNVESGWPRLLFHAEDLSRLPNISLAETDLSEILVDVLERDTLNVVRGVRAPKSSTPVGYSWGIALFSDGTWGLNSNMVPNTAGLRFSGNENFSVALTMDGNHLARDLVMQYLTATLRENLPAPNPGLMGSLVGCVIGDVGGVYVADTPDVVTVTTASNKIYIAITKETSTMVNLELTVGEDGRVFGSGRWDALQIEFFRHPDRDTMCLLIGQIVYIKIQHI